MNRYLKTSITSLFAVSLLAGGAFASSKDKGPDPIERQKIDQGATVDQGTTGSINTDNFMTNENVGAWKAGNITVVAVSTMNDEDPNKLTLGKRMSTNPDEVAALKSAIKNNPALKSQLESQSVQLENIVAAVKATDGSVTFYVK